MTTTSSSPNVLSSNENHLPVSSYLATRQIEPTQVCTLTEVSGNNFDDDEINKKSICQKQDGNINVDDTVYNQNSTILIDPEKLEEVINLPESNQQEWVRIGYYNCTINKFSINNNKKNPRTIRFSIILFRQANTGQHDQRQPRVVVQLLCLVHQVQLIIHKCARIVVCRCHTLWF